MTYKNLEKLFNAKAKKMNKTAIAAAWGIHRNALNYYLQCAKVSPDKEVPADKSKNIR